METGPRFALTAQGAESLLWHFVDSLGWVLAFSPDASLRGLQQTVAEVRPLALDGVIEQGIARELERAARRAERPADR